MERDKGFITARRSLVELWLKKIDFQSRGVIKIYETQQRKHGHTARGKVTDSRRDLNMSLMMFKSVTFRYYLLANIAERLKAFTAYWSTRITIL